MLRIALARHHDGNSLLSKMLSRKVQLVAVDTISFEPPRSWTRIDKELRKSKIYDWIILTSSVGASILVKHIRESKLNLDARFAAVGNKTAEVLSSNGLRVGFVPSQYTTERLAIELPYGRNVLLLRSNIASRKMLNILRKRGMRVRSLTLYRTIEREGRIKLENVDAIVFGSPSEVRAFVKCVTNIDELLGKKAFCIGPVTRNEAVSKGFKDVSIPDEYNFDSLASCINKWVDSND